uniref:Uncharacterized protein n=1 Tax=Zea mays TaxID=4577 RepID=A0A804ND93_MAIZE
MHEIKSPKQKIWSRARPHGPNNSNGFTSDFEPNNLAAIDTPERHNSILADASGGFGDMFCCEVCEPW